jgi:hypothetical protein
MPGAADIIALFQRHRREAGFAEAMQEIEASKAGSHDRDVDLLRSGTLRAGSRPRNHHI